jgi:chemotaxis protein methyltransferase CheR
MTPSSLRSPPDAAPLAAITDAEFALLRDLIHRRSGIHLGDDKVSLLVNRLTRRLRAHQLASFGDYYRFLMEGRHRDEMVAMLDRITTNETRFFRESRQFDFLENIVFPAWRQEAVRGERPRRVRGWSAACSTGEEAYTLAMCMLANFPRDEGWTVDVLGTDLSTEALRAAEQGLWPVDRASTIPGPYLRRFLRRGVRSQEGKMRASDELRTVVRFEHLNLYADEFDIGGPFDVVLCRNVLIYFAEPGRSQTLARVAGQLDHGGYLLLGHAETPGHRPPGLEPIQAMIFRAPLQNGVPTP